MLALGMGIGANLALFRLLNALLFRSAAYVREPSELGLTAIASATFSANVIVLAATAAPPESGLR